MSVIADIAEAVKTALNSHPFSQAFTAQRKYRPAFDLADMADLHVTVVPKGMTITPVGRDRNQHDVQVDVAVQKKVANDSEIDGLMALVEEVGDFLRFMRLEACPQACWVGTENTPIYAPDHLENLHQFTSVLTFTFRVLR